MINTQDIFRKLSPQAKRAWMKAHKEQCASYPESMQPEPVPANMQDRVLGTWRSRHYLAVAWRVPDDAIICRLSVNRTYMNPDTGAWLDGVTWDDLYRIKNECGYGDHDATEVYPATDKLVNVANIRHLWIMKERLAYNLESM